MTSVVSALTGSGSKKAASAQAGAMGEAIQTQREALDQQIAYSIQSLNVQRDMFDQAMAMGEPYRDAGSETLAKYESLLFGIPIEETAAYRSIAAPIQHQPRYDTKEQLEKELYDSLVYWNKTNGNGQKITDMDALKKEADRIWNEQEAQKQQALTEQQQTLQTLDGFSPDAMETLVKTPGYQFRMDEGQKALERSAAARSGVLSGAQIKATERYGQDYATNEFSNLMSRMGALIQTGSANAGAGMQVSMNSAGQQSGVLSEMGNAWGGFGDDKASLQTGIGAAKASGYLGQQAAGTNILNMAGQVAGAFAGGMGGSGTFSGMTGNNGLEYMPGWN